MTYSNDPFAGIPTLDEEVSAPISGYANAGHAFQAGETKLDDHLFTCEKCHGKGSVIIGYVNRRQAECFYCNGTGKRKTSAEHRAKLKATRQANDQKRKAEKSAKFEAWLADTTQEQRAAIKWLREQVAYNGFYGRSEFSTSMISRLDSRDTLTENMINAITRMHTKAMANQAKREAEKSAEMELNSVSTEFSALFAAFAKAHEEIAKPIFRVDDLKVSRAPDHGTNAGCLYVKSVCNDYLGKITPSGQFKGRASDSQRESLDALAKDPFAAVIKHGRDTGKCGCCGKELTKKQSIEDGIGPICKDKWGF
jgi:hypothetical protein